MQLMPLAPVDYVFTGHMSCPVTFAFEYSEILDAKRLQTSLDLLVGYIPWLGGRLSAHLDGSLAYELTDRPRVLIEVVNSQSSLNELADDDAVRRVHAFDREPLVNARLTQTPRGSILAVSMSHALVDGFSFFLTMSKWAACMRGESVEAPPMERLLLPLDAHVAAASRELSARSMLEESGFFWGHPRPDVRALPRQLRNPLRAEAIADLIAEAQRGVATKLSQNDVLSAWLWRTYGTKWWSGQGNPDVYLSCLVDMRRLLGEANASVFGCTISNATARATFDELVNAPLGELALRIRAAVAQVFAGGFEKRVASLEALRRDHGVQAMESVHIRHPQRGLLITNMSRLPLEQLDFGCGAPIDMKLYSEFDSMAALLPAPGKDGVMVSIYQPEPRRNHAAGSRRRPGDRSSSQRAAQEVR
ncbi:MAG: hypothetical protein RL701_6513 [Pseudomonadota bacterium]|jgi:hypothetical protein